MFDNPSSDIVTHLPHLQFSFGIGGGCILSQSRHESFVIIFKFGDFLGMQQRDENGDEMYQW